MCGHSSLVSSLLGRMGGEVEAPLAGCCTVPDTFPHHVQVVWAGLAALEPHPPPCCMQCRTVLRVCSIAWAPSRIPQQGGDSGAQDKGAA